jgi:hypothetical protein
MEPVNDNDPACNYRLSVYLIQAIPSGAVKIGIARCPGDRLKGLQIGNHEQLRLAATFPGYGSAQLIEQTMHGLLKPWHMHGEWFEGKWDEILRARKLATMRVMHPRLWDRYWAFAKARRNDPRLIAGWKWLWNVDATSYVHPKCLDGSDAQQLELL